MICCRNGLTGPRGFQGPGGGGPGPQGPAGPTTTTFVQSSLTLGSGSSTPNLQGEAAPANTTDGTTFVTAVTIPVSPSQGVDISASFVVRNTGASGGVSGDVYGFDMRFRWKRVGAAAPVAVGMTPVNLNPDGDTGESAVTARTTPSGNDVLIQVVGVAGHTLAWAVDYDIQVV